MTAELDDIDRTIIAALREDGRAALTSLGRLTGLGEQAVSQRIRRLRGEKILHVTAVVDMAEAGFPLQFLALVTVRDRPVLETAQEIAQIEEAVGVTIHFGEFDIMVFGRARDVKHVGELTLTRIAGIPGVHRVETDLCIEMYRYAPSRAMLV